MSTLTVHPARRNASKRRHLLLTTLFSVSLALSPTSGIGAIQTVDVLLPEIALRPGATVDMHARLFVNPEHSARGVTVLALHGFTFAGNSWAPFAESLLSENPAGRKVGQVVVLDMPGRGGSDHLVGLSLGEVTLQDYAAALIGSLDAFNSQNIRPRTLVAHSLGGLIVQMAQQRLIDEGSSFRAAYNIRNVVFLGTAAPAAVEADHSFWMPLIAMAQFLGWSVLPFPDFPEEWRSGGLFSNLGGELIPGTPSLDNIISMEYIGAEPLPVLLGMTGYPPYAVPAVDAGIFAPRYLTLLQTVSYEQDLFEDALVGAQVHAYLTGDVALEHFFIVSGKTTVHALHVANPSYLLERITEEIILP